MMPKCAQKILQWVNIEKKISFNKQKIYHFLSDNSLQIYSNSKI